MEYWVELYTASTGVFCTVPMALRFLKIEDKGQKVVHVTEGEEIRSESPIYNDGKQEILEQMLAVCTTRMATAGEKVGPEKRRKHSQGQT